MDSRPRPFDADLEQYRRQASELLAAFRSGDADAARIFHRHHPRFLDEKITWLPKHLSEAEVLSAALEMADAELAVSRCYDFADWAALSEYAAEAVRPDSPLHAFEAAVEAVVDGDRAGLEARLRRDPDLVRARSTRRCCFDPPVHRATLLHYIAANGVEGYRQRTPPNAVEIARTLLEAGAEVDSLASLYGTECTTMSLLVSSSHPAEAGVQGALVETLLDYGAAIEGSGTKKWGTPLITALIFGCPDAAHALERRGANASSLPAAAGLGRMEDLRRGLSDAGADELQLALALAALRGQAEAARALVDAGADPDRYHPENAHSHATPLHHAALYGHRETVRTLVEAGARLDIEDKIYHGTPLDWAVYGKQSEIADYLRSRRAAAGTDGGL